MAWTFIDKEEGNVLHAYWDNGGWAIGRGIHGPDINQNTVWTSEESDKRFGDKLIEIANAICPNIQPELSDSQLSACLSLAFNIGTADFNTSTLLKDINGGDMQAAGAAFEDWCHTTKPDGTKVVNENLLARRKKERALFLQGAEQPGPQPAITPTPPAPAPSGGKVNSITTHWQTSLVGVLLIIGALAKAGAELAQGQHVDMTTLGAGLAAGIGFLRTPDSNKVGPKQ